MFAHITEIKTHKVLLNARESLLSLKKNKGMTFAQQRDEVLGLIKTIGGLRSKFDTDSATNSVAALFFLADAYSYLSLLYNNMHSEERPMMRKAEKALNQAIECLDLIKDLSEDSAEVIDAEFVKKCNTLGISEVQEAIEAINNSLIDLLIQNTDDAKFVASPTNNKSPSQKPF